ncbi:hypothetical protein VNO78_27027 [Psophocarpus tetragonolobus]|uniref:Legume lectin domain-containing protein n=1 Tax=Psophocarpus tetragonolobus TaxID=3891 RepID=A0AAN9S0L8_PSOTE
MGALSNTKPVLLLLIPLLMLHRNSDTSFNFPNFSGPRPNTALTFQGDAHLKDGFIDPTQFVKNDVVVPSSGRATYSLPIRLWSQKTGKAASFTSNFTFSILHAPHVDTGDGISFFLAPFGSDMPKDSSGGFLGLFSSDTAVVNTDSNHIVAVEFDMHRNVWDPDVPHVGIDVNSIASVATAQWEIQQLGVATVFATVGYDSVASRLSVAVSDGATISHVVDLRSVLPEWVSVGFSGASGKAIEVHRILSWSFSSSFD